MTFGTLPPKMFHVKPTSNPKNLHQTVAIKAAAMWALLQSPAPWYRRRQRDRMLLDLARKILRECGVGDQLTI